MKAQQISEFIRLWKQAASAAKAANEIKDVLKDEAIKLAKLEHALTIERESVSVAKGGAACETFWPSPGKAGDMELNEPDYGWAFDGLSTVYSDADPGL